MNLLFLSDHDLADLQRRLFNEMTRRTKAATDGRDSASIISGNELAKRALVVAAAGRHSLLLVGPPSCGKTMLRSVAADLGLSSTFEALPCPCGWRTHPNHTCGCTIEEIDRHVAKLPVTDITAQMFQPSHEDCIVPGTSLLDMRQRISRASRFTHLNLDDDAELLLWWAVREMGIDEEARQKTVRIARTIANLEQSSRIDARHLSEAVNYRMLRR